MTLEGNRGDTSKGNTFFYFEKGFPSKPFGVMASCKGCYNSSNVVNHEKWWNLL